MILKKFFIFGFLTSVILFLGQDFPSFKDQNGNEPEQGREEYKVVVKIIGDEWRVVLEDDESQSDVTVRRGDRIRWTVEGSDASFAFPDTTDFWSRNQRSERRKSPCYGCCTE
jgi:hypothetical protein